VSQETRAVFRFFPNNFTDPELKDQSAFQAIQDAIDTSSATALVEAEDYTNAAIAGISGSGADVPTAGTTSPSPAYSPPEAPSNINPAIYAQDVNGNWHQQAGIDTTSVLNSMSTPSASGWGPAGVMTWTRKMFLRDDQAATQSWMNAFLSVQHTAGINTDVTNYQNQTLALQMQNNVTVANPVFAMTALQAETRINGAIMPAAGSSSDSEYTVISAQMSDAHTGSPDAPILGATVSRLQYFRQAGAGAWGSIDPATLKVLFTNLSAVDAGSQIFTGIYVNCTDGADGTSVHANGLGIHVVAPQYRLSGTNWGLYIDNFGSNANDYGLFVAGGQSVINGTLGLKSFFQTGTTIVVAGGFNVTGLQTTYLSALPPPTIAIVNGLATTYTYVLVARDAAGNGIAGTPRTTNVGPTTLSGSDFIVVEWPANSITGAASVDVYRTVGGPSQGKIATLSATYTSAGNNENDVADTGLAGDGTMPPTGNATGSIVAVGPITSGKYTVALLPTGTEGMTAYATNGRKSGEGSGAGTGVPVYFSNTEWRTYSTDAQVLS